MAQQGFTGLSGVPLDFWALLTMSPQLEEGASLFGSQQPRRLRIVGRLRHELSVAQAQAMLTAWAEQRIGDGPDAKNATRAILKLRATTIPLELEVAAFFSPIIAAFGLVLLIACANVASMMLARGMARQREIVNPAGDWRGPGAAHPAAVEQRVFYSLCPPRPA